MAIDEAIAEHVSRGASLPTLRFYGWDPPCLSLGYGQSIRDVDCNRLHYHGWDIVRRLTGGRAILHIDELTYSVAVPRTDPRVQGDIVQSYRRLSQGLLAGLELIGANARADKGDPHARHFKGPICFEVPSDYEITFDGRKLLGSAQTRREGAVLQHGALPLYGDIARICEALRFESDEDRAYAQDRLRLRAATLGDAISGDAIGISISFEETARLMALGIAKSLHLILQEADLSEDEIACADELRQTKYSNPDWIARR